MFRLVVLLVTLLLVALPTAAQDTPPDGCTRHDFADLLTTNAEALRKSDLELELQLHIFTAVFHAQLAVCAGFAFEGATNAVVGPVDLPAGDYIVNATFQDNGRIHLQTITDDCDFTFIGQRLGAPGSQGGIDSLILSTDTDCRVLAEVNAGAHWWLTFTPVE